MNTWLYDTEEIMDRAMQRVAGLNIEHVAGPEAEDVGPEEVIVLCLVSNGAAYIDTFITHYLHKLGAHRIVFLDNGSTDDTVARAASYEKVTVLQTHFPFTNNNDMRMRDWLVETYGASRWSLCVDIDEFFDYPFSDRLPLSAYLRYLNRHGYTAVRAHMVDMFPETVEPGASHSDDFASHCFYDLAHVERQLFPAEELHCVDESPDQVIYAGGIRKAIFGVAPTLSKHPLMFNDNIIRRHRVGHLIHNARIADVTAALFHYKYIGSFAEQVEHFAASDQFHLIAHEYRAYASLLERGSSLSFRLPTTRTLRHGREILEQGFVTASRRFRDYADRRLAVDDRRPAVPTSALPYEQFHAVSVRAADEEGFQGYLLRQRGALAWGEAGDARVTALARAQRHKPDSITVVVGVRDRPVSYLQNHLASLRAQNCDPQSIHIVVVDYGSSQPCADEIKRCSQAFDTTYVRVDASQWNRAHALNIGIRRARTKYVLCSDVDLIYAPNYVSTCYRCLREDPLRVVYATMRDIDENDVAGVRDPIAAYSELEHRSVARSRRWHTFHPIGISICATYTDYLREIQGLDEGYAVWGSEDTDLIERLRLMGLTIVTLDSQTSYVHQPHARMVDDEGWVKKNARRFRNAATVLRNNGRWGSTELPASAVTAEESERSRPPQL